MSSLRTGAFCILLACTALFVLWQRSRAEERFLARGGGTSARVCARIREASGESVLVDAPSHSAFQEMAGPLGAPMRCLRGVLSGTALHLEAVDGETVCKLRPMNGADRILCGLPIEVNRSSEEALMLLPGIGPKKARAIAETRTKEGAFGTSGDLKRVAGIGQKSAKKLEPWVTFD